MLSWTISWRSPNLAHGIFDGILFSLHLSELTSVLGMLLFLFFFGRLRRMGKARIERMRE